MKSLLKNSTLIKAATLISFPLMFWLSGDDKPKTHGSPENPILLPDSRPDSQRCISQAHLQMHKDIPRKPVPEGTIRMLSPDFPSAKEIFWFACNVKPENPEDAFSARVKCGADEYGTIGCIYPKNQKYIEPDMTATDYEDTDINEMMDIIRAE